MKIWIVSDLHIDSYPYVPNYVPEHDVMIVAGDVADGAEAAMKGLRVLHGRTGKPIVFTPGNHDLFDEHINAFDQDRLGPIYMLPVGETVEIGGVRFVGATLWTDWALGDKEWSAQSWAARSMPEYARVTRDDGELIWPIDTSNTHDLHRQAIEAVLVQPHAGPTVVITHHAPSARSLHAGEARGEEAGAFASDLEWMMTRYRPALWVHGHIHNARNYMVGGTRVVCNPRGYEQLDWYEKTGWIEDLVIEV